MVTHTRRIGITIGYMDPLIFFKEIFANKSSIMNNNSSSSRAGVPFGRAVHPSHNGAWGWQGWLSGHNSCHSGPALDQWPQSAHCAPLRHIWVGYLGPSEPYVPCAHVLSCPLSLVSSYPPVHISLSPRFILFMPSPESQIEADCKSDCSQQIAGCAGLLCLCSIVPHLDCDEGIEGPPAPSQCAKINNCKQSLGERAHKRPISLCGAAYETPPCP